MALRRRQQRQVGHALLRIGGDGLEQRRVVREDALDRRAIEQVRVVFERPEQAAGLFVQRHVQIELRRAGADRHEPSAHALEIDARVVRVLQREEHLEERRPAQIAFRLERLDERLERQVLVRVGVETDLADAREQLAEARVAAEIDAEHQRVHEESNQPFDLGAIAVRHRRSDDDVASTGVAGDERIPRSDERHEKRHAFATAQSLQRLTQLRRERELLGRAVLRLDRRPRAVGRDFERFDAGELLCPVGELALVDLAVHPLPLPHGVVGVLHRQRSQTARLAIAPGAIQRGELVEQNADRPAVDDDVVHDEHEPVFVLADFQERGAEQWARAQIERPACLAFRPSPRLVFAAAVDALE